MPLTLRLPLLVLLSTAALQACTREPEKDKSPETGETEDSDTNEDSDTSEDSADTEDSGDTDDSGDPPLDHPGPEFDRFCNGTPWDGALVPAVVGQITTEYTGRISSSELTTGTLETMKVIPPHPFRVRTIRVAYATGGRPARLRIMGVLGRSYPAGYPDIDAEGANLMAPIEIEVPSRPDPESWVEVDVSDRYVFLLPTQHYIIANEYLSDMGPTVGISSLAADESSRALLLVSDGYEPYGLDGNYRMELEGDYFCSWTEKERWFQEDTTQPFASDVSAYVATTDLNGDGHQDILTYPAGPKAWLGDGTGTFSEPAFEPFAGAESASMLLFGDIDNDGDQDAFASTYVGGDNDSDGLTLGEGDCNDANADVGLGFDEISDATDNDCDGEVDEDVLLADHDTDGYTLADGDCDDDRRAVYPGAEERDNGYDNDCDGIADDGTDTSDADRDGFSIADGDCDDDDAAIYPAAFEAPNGHDDDCDGLADEDDISDLDLDADGFSLNDGDCDDTQATVYPGATELFDSRDNDCDLQVDDPFHHRILLNDGTGLFSELESAGLEVQEPTPAAAWGDGNGDGNLDLYFGNWLEHYPDDPAVQDRYYEGLGDGTFHYASPEAGLLLPTPFSVYGVMWNDWNNDGHQDIFVGNYHLYDNQLWENQGDGTFEDVALEIGVAHDEVPSAMSRYPGGHTYGGDFGDVDNDGDMDFYMCNLAHPRNYPWGDPSMFVLNQGAPDYLYVNALEASGFIYDEGDVNAQFADFDNDMDLDLAIASLYTHHYARLYENDGEGRFTDISYEANLSVEESVSVVWADVDEDGDEDLLVADRSRAPYVHLYLNRVGQENHWVNLVLEGNGTNRDATGARATLLTAGVSQMRDVQGGGGLENTQRPRVLHFGLGENTSVESLSVRWVGGATESITGLGVDGWYRIVEGSGQAVAFEP